MAWRSPHLLIVSFAVACGSSSPAATSATPPLPGAPQDVYATAGSKSVTLQWTAPNSTGGAKILNYTVLPDPNAPGVTTGATSVTIPGLTDGTPYVFAVSATTANGTGPVALSNIVVPGGGAVPSAPIGVVAAARDAEARVSWAAPSSPGSAPITGYFVTVTPGGASHFYTHTSALLAGLVNGTTYEFSVEALNSAGAGPSAASNPVTPEADAGLFDGGAVDAATILDATDARAGEAGDGGPADAGGPDAGARDATSPGQDAGAHDAGARDAQARDGSHDHPDDARSRDARGIKDARRVD